MVLSSLGMYCDFNLGFWTKYPIERKFWKLLTLNSPCTIYSICVSKTSDRKHLPSKIISVNPISLTAHPLHMPSTDKHPAGVQMKRNTHTQNPLFQWKYQTVHKILQQLSTSHCRQAQNQSNIRILILVTQHPGFHKAHSWAPARTFTYFLLTVCKCVHDLLHCYHPPPVSLLWLWGWRVLRVSSVSAWYKRGFVSWNVSLFNEW